MAFATVFTMHLPARQVSAPGDRNLLWSAPYYMAPNLAVLSSSFRLGTPRNIGLSAARKGLPARVPVLASREASTSICRYVPHTHLWDHRKAHALERSSCTRQLRWKDLVLDFTPFDSLTSVTKYWKSFGDIDMSFAEFWHQIQSEFSFITEVEFTWKGQGSEVLLTGDFLNWEMKLALQKRSNGVFYLKKKLAPGRYSYKFIVDGEWKHSPDNPRVPDGTGGFNNEVIVAGDQITVQAYPDSDNATQGQFPLPTKALKDVAMRRPAGESESVLAIRNLGASVESSPRAIPKKAVAESLKETMSENVIPLLRNALWKEAGITDLDVTFEDNQLKTIFAKGDSSYCFWVFFPDGILEGSRGSSLTSHGSPPSTIEPFLVDEKKITPELLVFWIKKRLFVQKTLSMN